MPRTEVFNRLTAMDIQRVEVEYSGGGDEGGVDTLTYYKNDGTFYTEEERYYPDEEYNIQTGEYEPLPPPDDIEEILLNRALCEPVYDKYYSFAGDFYVSGKVVWNVKDKKVIMDDVTEEI